MQVSICALVKCHYWRCFSHQVLQHAGSCLRQPLDIWTTLTTGGAIRSQLRPHTNRHSVQWCHMFLNLIHQHQCRMSFHLRCIVPNHHIKLKLYRWVHTTKWIPLGMLRTQRWGSEVLHVHHVLSFHNCNIHSEFTASINLNRRHTRHSLDQY